MHSATDLLAGFNAALDSHHARMSAASAEFDAAIKAVTAPMVADLNRLGDQAMQAIGRINADVKAVFDGVSQKCDAVARRVTDLFAVPADPTPAAIEDVLRRVAAARQPFIVVVMPDPRN